VMQYSLGDDAIFWVAQPALRRPRYRVMQYSLGDAIFSARTQYADVHELLPFAGRTRVYIASLWAEAFGYCVASSRIKKGSAV